MNLQSKNKIIVKQVFEAFELIGFETRNKYRIYDEQEQAIGFAAEQNKGLLGFFLRQILGHWRKFDLHFFDNTKKLIMHAHHPFRFYFQRLDITDDQGNSLGAIEKRFSILSKKFDVLDNMGATILEMRSPIWRIWTFPFYRRGVEAAVVTKKWTGLLAEAFTDKDTFLIEYKTPDLTEVQKKIILATSVFIDLQYFEVKSKND